MKSVLFILLALAISKSLAGHLITDCGGIVELYEEKSCRTVPGNTQFDNEGGSNTPVATCDEVRQVYVENSCCADDPHKQLSDHSKLYEWCMTDTTHPVLTLNGSPTQTLTVGDTHTDLGATCTDNCADALSVLKSGIVDTTTPGTYTLTYNCVDKAHNGATTITRAVIVECPAGKIEQHGACVVPTPPVDCQVGQWSSWGTCSKECDRGSQVRTRPVVTQPENGGQSCPHTSEVQQCNMQSCDQDCVLSDWSDWGQCSKSCDKGWKIKTRNVLVPSSGAGSCPDENSLERYEWEWCNDFVCPVNSVCDSKIDVMLVADGSASVGWVEGAIWVQQDFAKKLVDKFQVGKSDVHMGVIKYGDQAKLGSALTNNATALKNAVDTTLWVECPDCTSATTMGVYMAIDQLKQNRRPGVSKQNTFTIIVMDSAPRSMDALEQKIPELKELSQVIIVGVTNNVNWPRTEPLATSQGHIFDAFNGWDDPDHGGGIRDQIPGIFSLSCPKLECDESMSGNGADYKGCQTKTRTGKTCQSWRAYTPHSHDGSLVNENHNFCRNPDGDSTIWCRTTDPNVEWDYCDPRSIESIPSDYTVVN